MDDDDDRALSLGGSKLSSAMTQRDADSGSMPVAAEHAEVDSATAPHRDNERAIDFAIVVGIDEYRAPLRRLKGAFNDAEAFYAWLCDENGGAVESRHIKRVPLQASGEATQRDIDAKLDEILAEASVRGGARRLYFYFSGHGAGNRRSHDDVALLLTQPPKASGRTTLPPSRGTGARLALSTDEYSSALRATGLFDEVAIFVDCCRAAAHPVVGLAPRLQKAKKATDPVVNPRSATKFVAYATAARKLAFELAGPDRWQGIFTRCLMAIFHRTSSDGILARDLKDLLHQDVRQMARRCNIDQHPEVHNGFEPSSRFGSGDGSPSGADSDGGSPPRAGSSDGAPPGERLSVPERLPFIGRFLQYDR